MTAAMQFYVTTLLIYFGVDLIACWAFNMQLRAGVLNFAFIVFQAVGAYTQAVLTLGPETANSGVQSYILGMQLPFPLPMIVAVVVGGAIALPVGWIALRRLDRDTQALTFIVLSIIATSVVGIEQGWFNGPTGLAGIPQPLSAQLSSLTPQAYSWLYVAFTGVVCLGVFWFVHRITSSPLGRTLRSLDDNEAAAAALGKNVTGVKVMIFVVGGALGALSGAVLVAFVGAWAPSGWLYAETFVLAAAIIIGGRGNNFGVMLGAAIVPVGFFEVTRYLPDFGRVGLVDAFQWMAIGLLFLLFLWFRPSGIVPERRRRYRAPAGPAPGTQAALASPEGAAGMARTATGGRTARFQTTRESPAGDRTPAPLLSIRDLRRGFGGVHAVDSVTFTVNRGATVGLIGPNGAGKSTVVNLVAGSLRPESGSISFDGHQIAGRPPHRIAQRGLIRTFQLSSQFSHLTVIENLLLATRRQRGDSLHGALLGPRYWRRQDRVAAEQAWDLMHRFEMAGKANEYAGSLSGGQRRLVELMRALMAEPALLLLDEPMAGVSPALASRIEQHLEDLRASGMSMLIIEHELGVIDRLCQSVVVMAEGKVLSEGTMAEVRRSQEVIDAYIGA